MYYARAIRHPSCRQVRTGERDDNVIGIFRIGIVVDNEVEHRSAPTCGNRHNAAVCAINLIAVSTDGPRQRQGSVGISGGFHCQRNGLTLNGGIILILRKTYSTPCRRLVVNDGNDMSHSPQRPAHRQTRSLRHRNH